MRARSECSDPGKVPAWLPMLGHYGPSLLVQCQSALELSKEFAEAWLKESMFKNEPDQSQKASSISKWLADHKAFKSHSRHIPRSVLEQKGLNIFRMESEPEFQDLALSVFHATTHTFACTPVTKIVENHLGRAFIKVMGPMS